jgi:hypothetical protein
VGLDSRQGQGRDGTSLIRHSVKIGSGAHPASYPMGTDFPEEERPKREADHLHLVLRLRVSGTLPPLLQYVFMAWCLVK